MPGRNFSGLTPIENSGVNQHMPFAQKIFSDEKAFWNVDEWDLPAGAEMRENQNKDQATVYLLLKEFHESPEGEAFLVSVNFTEHQRRNVLNNKGFTKAPGEIRFCNPRW